MAYMRHTCFPGPSSKDTNQLCFVNGLLCSDMVLLNMGITSMELSQRVSVVKANVHGGVKAFSELIYPIKNNLLPWIEGSGPPGVDAKFLNPDAIGP